MADARARVGIDLGGTKIKGVLLDADGQVVREQLCDTPRDDYAGTLQALVAMARALDPAGTGTVGVGTPGSMAPGSRRMRNCNSTWLNGRCLLDDLTELLGERVRIANDADCFALSEAHGGAADGAASVFGVILGTGVGGGLVVGGELLQGPNGLSGEWGHTSLPRFPGAGIPGSVIEERLQSRQCYCGQLNCVETFLSGPGLAATHTELWGETLAGEQVYAQARPLPEALPVDELDAAAAQAQPADGARRAQLTLTLWCRQLARGLAQVINIVDPAVIVLGGGLSNMRELYLPVRSLLAQETFGGGCRTPVLAPAFGAASGVRGAAWLYGGPGGR